MKLHTLDPEVIGFVALVVCTAFLRVLFPRQLQRSTSKGDIRICLHTTPRADVSALVQRYTVTCSNLYRLSFGILIECDCMEDVLLHDASAHKKSGSERVIVHHIARIDDAAHVKRLKKMRKHFVNGMEDMVVFADHRVFPEFGWDAHLLNGMDENELVTCPLCVHAAGFPTHRERSNGDVVRDEARCFVHPGEVGVFVPSVCLCYEFFACRPLTIPLTSVPQVVVLPTFPIIQASTRDVEDVILDVNLQVQTPVLTNSGKMGLSSRPSGIEMYHKYGSTSAVKLAIKLDRRQRRNE